MNALPDVSQTPTTSHDVNAFCNDSRDLAASINAFVEQWEQFMATHKPPLTERSKRRVLTATMVLETAIERLAGIK